MPNRLIGETSPYLLQHAQNPVDWYPWGEEAFNRAIQEDRPVLLSIGYSACHWCHVMERESFENEYIANIMNEYFVNIKVDREERPDLDAVYMEAVQAMTGRGGWPLTVFLAPDKRPFFGGTYFPPEDRQGMPGLPKVLKMVVQAYRTRRGEVKAAADDVITHLNRSQEPQRSVEPLTTEIIHAAFTRLKSEFDKRNGGLGTAPKFPQPMVFEFLLQYHYRHGKDEALAMVEHTLNNMARGGIYDQIGGGFHRYSVDDHWLVPHFEKMLYDNALLARLYLHGYQATGKPLYRRIVKETLDYVLREMQDSEGGFYSAQDADSEGVEGKYYVWTPGEIIEALGEDDGQIAIKYFGVTDHGNFEGSNILNQVIETESLTTELGLSSDEIEARIAGIKARLREKRVQRIAPHLDNKVLTDWNGLMLSILAEAALVLDREDYLQAAINNANFLLDTMLDRDVELLKHAYKDGHAKIPGYLLDHALICDGLLSLYEATFDPRWLNAARKLATAMISQFWDDVHGCFYDSGYRQEALVVRPRNIFDNALPSGSAMAASVLIHLARLTDSREHEKLAAAAIRSVHDFLTRYPSGFSQWLCALDLYLSQPKEIAIFGSLHDPATKSLIKVI
ncbi:MAG: thioredoxin domain-containing protein, partial [Dehalococcoidia bacterium]